jgi:hypothetical protein
MMTQDSASHGLSKTAPVARFRSADRHGAGLSGFTSGEIVPLRLQLMGESSARFPAVLAAAAPLSTRGRHVVPRRVKQEWRM